jgi:hypothetical protein
MGHPRFSGEEIARRGEKWYERSIRPQVKTEGNIGKILSIDIETGDFEVGEDPLITSRRLQARHPDAAIWTKRVGYDAVYAIGGDPTRFAEDAWDRKFVEDIRVGRLDRFADEALHEHRAGRTIAL